MRIIMVILGAALLVNIATATHAQELWVAKDGSVRNVDGRALAVDRSSMYLATKSEVYRAKDAREKWETVFSIPAGANEINCLAVRGKGVLVGTRRGLYGSEDSGATWKNVFRTILPDKNNIYSIEISRHDPRRVVIGTGKGVFSSGDFGGRWQDVSDNLRNKCVKAIALNKDSIYASCDNGFYVKRNNAAGWERIYIKSPGAEPEAPEYGSDYTEPEESGAGIGCIAFRGSRLYLGIGKRILCSDTGGKEWSDFSCDGLGGAINYILVSEKSERMYCATTKGVFEFFKEKSRWSELYGGMDKAADVYRIVFDGEAENSVWSLTDNGLYKLEAGRYMTDRYMDIERNITSMKILAENEPTAKELQQAALRFAELGPEKIRNWRSQARLRALVPRVSCGWDKDRSTTAEIYTSATKDYFVMGPDDIKSGFDISVSWELADLIWSDDQTNIDVRSRLTTQLRNDVLDDLRRAYYERRRLQWELVTEPPKDLKTRFEKELRVQELTQAIDDLTGNYLSDNIKR